MSNFNANSQCGAIDFYSPDTIVCNPAFVQFNTINLPVNATVEWDFGNGKLVGNPKPMRLYEVAGEYTIKAKITLVNNAVCEIEKKNYIKVKPKPEINVTWDKHTLCNGPETVTITDLSPNILNRTYIIQGTAYTDVPKVFEHDIDSSYGIKNIYVFSTDSFGCRNVKSYDSAIYQYWGFDTLEAFIDYSPKQYTCGPIKMNFSRTIPIEQNHHFENYKWTFESKTDKFTTNGSEPEISLPEGLYNVTNTLTNSSGCNYSITKEKWFQIYDSIDAKINVSKTSVCTGEAVTFTVTNKKNGEIIWDFDSVPVSIISQTDNAITVSFNRIGKFGVTIIYNNNTCSSTKKFNDLVNVKGPNPLFSLPLTRTCVLPKTFRAINISDLTGAGTTQYWWEVINQKTNQTIMTSTSKDSIVFDVLDTAYYTIKLKVTGSTGCIDSLVMKDAVAMDTLLPTFSIVPHPACKGQKITLTATTVEGTTGIENEHYWEIYDKSSTNVLFSGTDEKQIIQLPDTGYYSVLLKATNEQGCYGNRFFKDTILIEGPQVKFSISDSLPCRAERITLFSEFPEEDYPDFDTRWILQHTDSNINIRSDLNIEDYTVALRYPGIYNVRYYYRSSDNQCADTINAPFRIKVSGISMTLSTTDSFSVCEPLDINWKGTILSDYNFKNKNPNTYTWKAKDNMVPYTSFTPNSGLKTLATYYKRGSHQTRIVVNHGSGCLDSFYTNSFTVGTTANFSFVSNIRCVNSTTPIRNTSLNATEFKWVVDDPSSVEITPNDTIRSPSITAKKEGDYYITLYSIGPGGCRDTTTKLIRVINPSPEFYSSDTVQFCAPVLATFTPMPVWYGSEYRWYFGDGDTFTTSKPKAISHVYSRNTETYGTDVMLVVKTPGCIDTTNKVGYMKVIGPIPEYDYSVKSGCEPLRVDFVNTSRNFSRFYFDYGDGTAIDSTVFIDYKYRVMDKSQNVQCYKTKLVLIDNNGCFAAYEHEDDVCVKKSAEPYFTTKDTLGCETYKVEFQNNSLYGVDFKWDFKGDGNYVESENYNATAYYSAGVYYPRMIAYNINGCADTSEENKVRIWVQPKPKSFFKPESDSICYNYPLQFYALPETDNNITSYAWNFGDISANGRDTSSKENPVFSFKSPLQKYVTLVVTDSNACKDTFSRYIHVIDTLSPPNKGLHFVTVLDNKDILGVWEESKAAQFSKYTLFQDEAGYTKIYETSLRSDTSYLVNSNININAKRYCYTTTIGDTCRITSKYSPPHCTISAKVDKYEPSKLLINWIKYIGWDYDDFWGNIIYRSEEGGEFIAIDTVDNLTDSYIDNNLCEREYCYYIEAVHKNKEFRSVSNIVCETPDYIYPTDRVAPRKATVINNEDIKVQWTPYMPISNFGHYSISRIKNSDNSSIEGYDTTSSLSFIDFNADVVSSSYTYHISVVDKCGFTAPKSIESTTILLNNKIKNYRANISWNPYKEWEDGINKYVVEEENEFGDYIFVKELPPDSNSFIFTGINVVDNRDVCLRVYAVRNGLQDTSYSNVSCDIPESQLFIPNIFSPNNDGLNDVFKPSAIYIKNESNNRLYTFEMEIFDRWGNKIFYTNNIDEGWDGNSQNIPCPTGVYLYKIRAIGLDGKPYDFKGTIQLIR